MQTVLVHDTTNTRPNAPSSSRVGVAVEAHVAAAAFAVLALSYGREEVVTITIAAAEGDASADAIALAIDKTVTATSSDTLGAIAARARARIGEWPGARVRLAWAADAAELSLVVRLADGGVEATASREHGVFRTSGGLRRAARHLRAALRAFASEEATRAREVPLLGPAERRRVIRELAASESAPDLEAPGLLHRIFEERARSTPDRVAVIAGAERTTYRELDARADRLARGLRARGIGPGSFVGLLLPRSADVYAAMLGVLKAGAAYVPLDPELPRERVERVLSGSGVAVLFTASSLCGGASACPSIDLDEDWDRVLPIDGASSGEMCPSGRQPTPDDLAYVIYTSGSTGEPKGVAIAHASAVHLVRAEQRMFEVRAADRVFQGFSIAFDAAVEEIWLAFAAGAALVCGTKEMLLSDLARHLTDAGVTVLSTVPTLLASIDGDLPTVRLLIVGGEACPQALVDRWATPRRAMYNTYGPTEATVIATWARLEPGEPVTIGRPIPNYRCYVLDRAGRPAPEGVAGEICIGGIGLARGYLGRPDLTAARFVRCSFAGEDGAPAILYKTGDLGRFDDAGRIEFLGRGDEQIKLRGFRIELGEIEAALLAQRGIANAAVAVREDTPGEKRIVAYVVPRADADVDDAILSRLRASLPSYMVPSRVVRLGAFPTLTSGKVDKRALPAPEVSDREADAREATGAEGSPCTKPRGAIEEAIARCWADLFGVAAISRDEDFFRDLGGHSLLAARAASQLRREPALAALSVLDVYEHPTPAALAARHTPRARREEPRAIARPPRAAARPRACWTAQLIGLYGLFGVHSTQWLAPYLAYVALRAHDASAALALAVGAVVLLAVNPALLFVALCAKWLVVGRYRPGRHALWGGCYLRFWIVDRLLAIAPTTFLVGTPLLPAYYRLLGAKIGANVHLASDDLRCFDLVTIGDDTSVGAEASLAPHTFEDGELRLEHVRIGARCVVGARSVVAGGATLGDDASLDELSLLPRGGAVPAGERWTGSPARFVARAGDPAPVARPSWPRRALLTGAYAIGTFLLPGIVAAALLPGLVALNALERRLGMVAIAASPVVAASFVVALCAEIALVKWIFLGRVRPGRYALSSFFVFRKWAFDRALAVSLDVLGGLYATLFLVPWYRLLGVRIGRWAEVSTASSIVPDLLQIGDDAFVADCVALGPPRVGRGVIDLEPTRVGARAFVGNSAVVGAGTAVGDDCLVGCLSSAPRRPAACAAGGASWFGSPPIALPQRQASAAFPASATYRPPRTLVAQRLAIEALRVTLPTTCVVALSCLLLEAAVTLHARLPLAGFVAVFPLLYVGFGVAAALVVVAMKWALIGRYRPGERPLWSTFVWRNELVTAMQENLADPYFTELLRGTPFAAWFFRALGAKIGRRVYMGTTQLTEYDLVSVGDDACLNADCTLQTHLFEDRVMKMSNVTIGAGCSVGAESIVLYDAEMEGGSALAPLSIVMKGETLPAKSCWAGSPARPAERR